MDKQFSTLYDFISSAVRSRKYPENTANGLRAALKLFEAELNEEEKGSIKVFSDRLEQIYSSVFAKNQSKFSAGSLATYKSRVLKVLGDYMKYGIDPTKMVNWNPKTIKRSPRKRSIENQHTGSASGSLPEVSGELAPPRTLPSGIVVLFPKSMDAHVTFGEFGEELKRLNEKGLEFSSGDSVSAVDVEEEDEG